MPLAWCLQRVIRFSFNVFKDNIKFEFLKYGLDNLSTPQVLDLFSANFIEILNYNYEEKLMDIFFDQSIMTDLMLIPTDGILCQRISDNLCRLE